jgi:hypothetical protein
MFLKIFRTFVTEPPAVRIAKLSRRLPAANKPSR